MRTENKKVALVTGVFDIVHPGHIELFRRIREKYPDYKIVVGINGDRRTKEIKKIVAFSAEQRKKILEAIRYVDEVIIFEENGPSCLIEKLCPDVFVKGGDWEVNKMKSKEVCDKLGIKIDIIPITTEIHSSQIKSKIIEQYSGN